MKKAKDDWNKMVAKPLRERVDSLEEVERQATSIGERLRRHLEKTASIHVNSGATLRDLFTWCEEKIIEPASSAVAQMAQWEINVAPAMRQQVIESANQLQRIPGFQQQLGEMLRELHPVYQTLVNKAVQNPEIVRTFGPADLVKVYDVLVVGPMRKRDATRPQDIERMAQERMSAMFVDTMSRYKIPFPPTFQPTPQTTFTKQ